MIQFCKTIFVGENDNFGLQKFFSREGDYLSTLGPPPSRKLIPKSRINTKTTYIITIR
jgi:hypothetical protein